MNDKVAAPPDASALSSWSAMNAALRSMKEAQCWLLLAEEKKGRKRIQFLLRIFGKANKLRTERERKELFR